MVCTTEPQEIKQGTIKIKWCRWPVEWPRNKRIKEGHEMAY